MFNAQLGRRVLLAVPFAASLAIGGIMPVYAADLGPANNYNVFVFGDMNQSSDSEGRVAVGGNATFTNFGIGDRLSNSNGSDARLVVGGNLNYNGGQVFGGNAVYGGTATLSGGANTNNGSFIKGSSPVDFNAAKQELSKLSSDLGGIAATGS
ncbi:MAG TPA: collagen-binding domain-containing protein, partial [Kamptonema sp.]|nr:collagen-binding domain-containing protein [Kamptonema sp.]